MDLALSIGSGSFPRVDANPCHRSRVPNVVTLVAKSGQLDRSIVSDFHQAVAAILVAGALDHCNECAVVNSLDFVVVVLVTVSLENGKDVPSLFEDLPNIRCIFDGIVVTDIEALMSKDDRFFRCHLQVCLEPFQLFGRQIGIVPRCVASFVRIAITSETSIQNYEVKLASVEGVVRGLLANTC